MIWFGLVIYETLSTITFISYFIGVLIVVVSSIFFRRRTGLSSSIVQLLIIGMVVLLVVIFLNEIGEWILSIASNNSTTIGVRLKSLAYMLLGNDSGGLYSENRMYLPIVSLKTFLQNPLFGVAYKHGNGFYRPYLFGVANHCEWADTLANYGLVGGIPLLYIYFSNINKIYKNRTLSFGLVISFLILGMFNPFRCVQTSVVLFFLIPAINVYLNS